MKTESNRIKLTSKSNTAHATARMAAKHGSSERVEVTAEKLFIVRSVSSRGGFWGTGKTLTEAEAQHKKAGGRAADVSALNGRVMFEYPSNFNWELVDGRVCGAEQGNEGVDSSLIKYTYL